MEDCGRRNENKTLSYLAKEKPVPIVEPKYLSSSDLWNNFPFPKIKRQQKHEKLPWRDPDGAEQEDSLAVLILKSFFLTPARILSSHPRRVHFPRPPPLGFMELKSQAIYFQTKVQNTRGGVCVDKVFADCVLPRCPKLFSGGIFHKPIVIFLEAWSCVVLPWFK